MPVFIGNTNLLKLTGLKSNIDNSFINDASVAVTLLDSSGEEVSGQSWPITLDFVSGSSGDYRVTLSYNLPLVESSLYTAVVTADGGDGRQGRWELKFKARVRTED